MKLARREPARVAVTQALIKVFTALAIDVGRATFDEHVEAALRAVGGREDDALEIMQAAATALIDEWTPSAWNRVPAPAEVRRAIFNARRARVQAGSEASRRALTEAALTQDEAKHLIDELAEKLGWGKDWRNDAARTQDEAIKQRVKELLKEAEAAAHRPKHRPRRPGPRG